MKTLDWLNNEIIGNGLLCAEYTERVRNAKSKKQLFDVCADANGVSFIPLHTKRYTKTSVGTSTESTSPSFLRHLVGNTQVLSIAKRMM